MASRISASIVIYNNKPDLLKKAVDSILSCKNTRMLFLIDNSESPLPDGLFSDPRVRYLFNKRNIGFGAAHNIAMKEILSEQLSDYHVVLNPDVFFDAQVIQELVDYMEVSVDVGLAMPKVLYPDGRLQPLCKMLPNPFILFSRRFIPINANWIRRMNYWYEMHFSGYDKIMDVPFLSGCFMFLRTDALKRVGLFDEKIFLYTEDIDLTRRMSQQYRSVFFPHATIYHYHEKASYKKTLTMIRHMQSAIRYFNKWGWFIDRERKYINERAFLKLQS